jgi:hypothetical protein
MPFSTSLVFKGPKLYFIIYNLKFIILAMLFELNITLITVTYVRFESFEGFTVAQ